MKTLIIMLNILLISLILYTFIEKTNPIIENLVGKNINIKIKEVNQNSLFGKVEKNKMRAA